MFPKLLRLIARPGPADSGHGFVEEVRLIDAMPARNRRVERLILAGWLAIAVKCVAVVWLVGKYHMHFSPLWVTAPTVFFGLMCTAAYYFRE